MRKLVIPTLILLSTPALGFIPAYNNQSYGASYNCMWETCHNDDVYIDFMQKTITISVSSSGLSSPFRVYNQDLSFKECSDVKAYCLYMYPITTSSNNPPPSYIGLVKLVCGDSNLDDNYNHNTCGGCNTGYDPKGFTDYINSPLNACGSGNVTESTELVHYCSCVESWQCEDTCSSKPGTDFAPYGTGCNRRIKDYTFVNDPTNKICKCTENYETQCQSGYYGNPNTNCNGCEQCPTLTQHDGTQITGQSVAGSTQQTDCYIPAGTQILSQAGKFTYKIDAHYPAN